MEITIKINGRMVSVEVSGEVADCHDQFKHKTYTTKNGGIGIIGNLMNT